MSKTTKKKMLLLVAVCTIGTVFQVFPLTYLPGGCAEYLTYTALSSFDFCSVFNCSGGAFFDFCNPVPLLADCP